MFDFFVVFVDSVINVGQVYAWVFCLWYCLWTVLFEIHEKGPALLFRSMVIWFMEGCFRTLCCNSFGLCTYWSDLQFCLAKIHWGDVFGLFFAHHRHNIDRFRNCVFITKNLTKIWIDTISIIVSIIEKWKGVKRMGRQDLK